MFAGLKNFFAFLWAKQGRPGCPHCGGAHCIRACALIDAAPERQRGADDKRPTPRR